MVSSSEVRTECPSISFLFARLRGSLGVFPHLENFISEGNSLGIVVADLLPLIHQSIDWFRDLVREVMSEVRSSELETGLSSSDEPTEGDTAVSASREVRPSLDLRIGFNSLTELGFVYLVKVNGLAIFFRGRCAFMNPPFLMG